MQKFYIRNKATMNLLHKFIVQIILFSLNVNSNIIYYEKKYPKIVMLLYILMQVIFTILNLMNK